MDFAKRAYDHSFPRDWIVRSLLDTDFYKILMHQFIYRNFFNVKTSFETTNRTKTVFLSKEIDIDELRAQLDHVRTLNFTQNELVWLTGQTFYGQSGIFSKAYIDYLRSSFKLSDYTIEETEDNQYKITFFGKWVETTLWELYALTITNELRYRGKMRLMSKSQLDIMYARAKVKLYAKLEKLAKLDGLNLTDFGTRRRHSFLWQEYVVTTMTEVLGDKFTGTSNCYIAMTHGLDAKGTNAHELPMTLAALATTPKELQEAQYKVCQLWQDDYRGNLLVFLPDTFGTTQFLRNAPEWLANWAGARPDSKEPIEGGEELIAFWESHNQNPLDKLIVFSDGLDVEIEGFEPQGANIIDIYNHFHGRVKDGYGWGTMGTNDFLGCVAKEFAYDFMKPISLVCKAAEANNRVCIKISDNYSKATKGHPQELAYYTDNFGTEGIKNAPVNV